MKCSDFDRECNAPEWCQEGGPCLVTSLLDLLRPQPQSIRDVRPN